jgi:hypothetical protein
MKQDDIDRRNKMKKYWIVLAMVVVAALNAIVMGDDYTARVGITKPSIGSAGWGTKVNDNYDLIDSTFGALSQDNTWLGVNIWTGLSTMTGPTQLASTTISGPFAFTGTMAVPWPTSAGGSGNDWSGVRIGGIPYFNGTGSMATLAPGTTNYLLQTNGNAAPSYVNPATLSVASAASVTNGVYTTGSYSNPAWITSVLGSIVSGPVANATAAVTATNIAGGALGQIPYQSAAGTTNFISTGTEGQALIAHGSASPTFGAYPLQRQFSVTFDGGGSAITTGKKNIFVRVPSNVTLLSWEIVQASSGTFKVDVLKSNWAGLPPTSSIVASSTPTASAVQFSSGTCSGWAATTLSAGDYLDFNVLSVNVSTRAVVNITATDR